MVASPRILNNYILGLILANNNLRIKTGITTSPINFVSSGATASSSQKVLSYNDLIFGQHDGESIKFFS